MTFARKYRSLRGTAALVLIPLTKLDSRPSIFRLVFSSFFSLLFFYSFLFYSVLEACAQLSSGLPDTDLFSGPIPLTNQHPLALSHLSFKPERAKTLRPKTLSIQFENSISNTVNREEGSFLIDAESRESRMLVGYGLTQTTELQLSQALIWEGSGFTDQSIDEWHKFFGFPRGPRRRLKKDRFIIFGNNIDGTSFAIDELDERGTHFGDLDVSWKQLVYASQESPILASLRFSARLPTGEEAFGQHSTDLELASLFEYRLNRVHFYSGISYTHLFDSERQGIHFMPNVFAGFLGCLFTLNDSLSVYFGLNPASNFLSGVEQFPQYQLYFDTALLYRFTPQLEGNFLIRENPSPEDSTTDITLSIGLIYHFVFSDNSKDRISHVL